MTNESYKSRVCKKNIWSRYIIESHGSNETKCEIYYIIHNNIAWKREERSINDSIDLSFAL